MARPRLVSFRPADAEPKRVLVSAGGDRGETQASSGIDLGRAAAQRRQPRSVVARLWFSRHLPEVGVAAGQTVPVRLGGDLEDRPAGCSRVKSALRPLQGQQAVTRFVGVEPVAVRRAGNNVVDNRTPREDRGVSFAALPVRMEREQVGVEPQSPRSRRRRRPGRRAPICRWQERRSASTPVTTAPTPRIPKRSTGSFLPGPTGRRSPATRPGPRRTTAH